MSAPIHWYEKIAFDAPRLNSPQPCIHGAGCVFTVKNAEGVVTPGCCRYVHPGEEGTGRRLFPARTIKKDGKDIHQPACVRLTGGAAYYERRSLHLSWQAWCERTGIAYTPNKAGERHEPVKRVGFGKRDEIAAVGRAIAERAVARFDDPIEREVVQKEVAAHMAAHPEQGWDNILAVIKAEQEKDAAALVSAKKLVFVKIGSPEAAAGGGAEMPPIMGATTV